MTINNFTKSKIKKEIFIDIRKRDRYKYIIIIYNIII